MSSHFGRFDDWSTGTKLVLLLSIALLPLGLALAWTARNGIGESEQALRDVSRRQGLSGARAVDAIIARNALALRVAANAALRRGASDPCREVSLSLALTPAVAERFVLRDSSGSLICIKGQLKPQPIDEPLAPGAIELSALPSEGSLYYQMGIIGGMASGRLTAAEIAEEVRASEPGIRQLSIRDSRGAVLPVLERAPEADELPYRASYPAANGRLTVTELTAVARPGLAERLSVLLPILMFIGAAVASWLLVKMLLTRPLSRLQRAVNEYQPGADRLVLPERLGSAQEIRSLGASFERAVDRIEESEHRMAEALEGQRRLVREVHHRVKNNLQVIASLLSIHGRSAATPESREAYVAIGRRVDALSVVHRNHFAEVEESIGIPLRPLLVELSAILRASAPGSAKTVVQLDVDPLHTTQDAAVAVSFFVTEVVEYAMLNAPGEPIEIELRRLSELAAALTISSNALLDGDGEQSTARRQFDRVVGGLARQLRSPLEWKMGRLGVNLPVFPERL